MGSLVAQNGLAYTINLIYLITMDTDQFKEFKGLFGNLVDFVEKINDDGIVIHFTLNIDEELSKLGRFKDIPSRTEIRNYMPIIVESELFLRSDILFLKNIVELYNTKERYKNKQSEFLYHLEEKIKKAIEEPYIQIRYVVDP